MLNRVNVRMLATAIVGALFVAACSGNEPEGDLLRDLERASTPAIDLLPRSGSQQVVSDIESAPAGQRAARTAPAPARSTSGRAITPAPSRRTAPRPAPVERGPDPAPVNAPATPRPSSAPATQPAPPGGFKTMEEMIRKAPFPINP